MVRELDSLDGIEFGYVLNYYGRTVGNRIHPHNCPHIQRMSVPPRKVWADSVQELEAWLHGEGADLDPTSPRCEYI